MCEVKECKKCRIIKPVEEFYPTKKSSKCGVISVCKICDKERSKQWREKNKEFQKNYNKLYREQNRESLVNHSKNYYKQNKKSLLKKKKDYYVNNKEEIKGKKKERYQELYKYDKVFKFKENIRISIQKSFKNKGLIKSKRTLDILGIDLIGFKNFIEKQFEPWMSWENYGKYNGQYNFGWDLDHIIPVSSGKTEEEVIKLNHYTNFQPLCSKINRHEKRNKHT